VAPPAEADHARTDPDTAILVPHNARRPPAPRGRGQSVHARAALPSTAAGKASRHDARTHERLRPGVVVNETARGWSSRVAKT